MLSPPSAVMLALRLSISGVCTRLLCVLILLCVWRLFFGSAAVLLPAAGDSKREATEIEKVLILNCTIG